MNGWFRRCVERETTPRTVIQVRSWVVGPTSYGRLSGGTQDGSPTPLRPPEGRLRDRNDVKEEVGSGVDYDGHSPTVLNFPSLQDPAPR